MKKKIELTELEERMLQANIDCTFFPPEATDEECKAMISVLRKAEDLMHELKAYDEIGTNLMLWFQNKYKAQHG